jgi:phosphatidate cytidylyltransferase
MLKTRIITALVLAPIGITAVLKLEGPWFAGAIGALFLVALWEWSRLIGIEMLWKRVAFLVVHLAIFAVLWRLHSERLFLWIATGGALWWVMAGLWLANFRFAARPGRFSRGVKTIAGILIVIPAWCAAVYLHEADKGPYLLLGLLVLIWVADVSAYFTGRAFGKTKLAPRISPGKTRAGLYGALMASAFAALLIGFWLKVPTDQLPVYIVLSCLTVLASVEGDLFESLIKRHSDIKDSGRIFPGHGGAFDRLDSLFAALPVFVVGRHFLL